jgi:hypothetical protein
MGLQRRLRAWSGDDITRSSLFVIVMVNGGNKVVRQLGGGPITIGMTIR